MMRSQVQGQNNGPGSVVSNTRTSKTGWLQDSFHPAIKSTSQRVSDITGLNTDTFQDESELLQVQIKCTFLTFQAVIAQIGDTPMHYAQSIFSTGGPENQNPKALLKSLIFCVLFPSTSIGAKNAFIFCLEFGEAQ